MGGQHRPGVRREFSGTPPQPFDFNADVPLCWTDEGCPVGGRGLRPNCDAASSLYYDALCPEQAQVAASVAISGAVEQPGGAQ